MITMSDFTNEQLKAIVAFGIDKIKEELEERIEIENKTKFPISIGDYFFNEFEQCVFRITNVTNDRINYEFVSVMEKSIISSYNSWVDRDSHDFDSMVRIDKEKFDAIQKIAKNYEKGVQELKLSSIKFANNIFRTIK